MLKAFLYTNSSSDWIFEGVKSEAEWRVVVQNFIEELSALFYFEIVWSVKSSFVDSTSSIKFFGLSFTTRDKHVKSNNIIDGKFLRINSLFKSFFVNDNFISIYQMFFEFMR